MVTFFFILFIFFGNFVTERIAWRLKSMGNVDDHFYIQQIKAGNTQAFNGIVSKYQSRLLTIIAKITGNRQDAEDILQEVFLKVFQSLEQFKGEAEFSTWLYRVAYNTTLSELRKKKVAFVPMDNNFSAENEPVNESIDEMDTEHRLHCLNTALKRLSPDDAFLITLYYLKEQSIDEIGQISNLSISNVKVRLHRIRKKLAAEINQLINDENNR
ncbi:MAG: RNA polymerase sigma factor [Dysgonamonadaceae bacterium]|jgi:RNA polymerase sigma-70 factor (ECF subfamily)|nr:RNA polymerase sigma factor [Dysgonamonadaceae bacterium]